MRRPIFGQTNVRYWHKADIAKALGGCSELA
jgi:hypothetical protein